MMTLDEVINIFEKACDLDQRCEDCSGCLGHDEGCPNDGASAVPDALYYLKEYRSDKAMWEADRKGYLDWIEQYKEAREKHQQAVIELKKNPPLTWTELKGMVGKPVWFEGYAGNFWCIVREMQKNSDGTEDVIFDGPHGMTGVGHDDQYGDKWQVYRKERNENAC